MKTLSYTLCLLFSLNIFCQSQSSFKKGFTTGYSETLKEEGYNGNYFNYSNPNDCYSEFSSNRNNTYSEGYRCGVKQASKALPKIKKSAKSNYVKSNNQDIRRKTIVGQQNKIIEANERQQQYRENQQRENQRINSEASIRNTQQRTTPQRNQYAASNYGAYVQTVNTNLVGQVLRNKQRNYNKKKLQEKKEEHRYNEAYKNEILSDFKYYFQVYDKSINSLKEYKGYFNFVDTFLTDAREAYKPYFNSAKNFNSKSMTELEEIQQNLAYLSNNLEKYFGSVNSQIQKYKNNPNTIVSGYYNAFGIIDYDYNENKGQYEVTSKIQKKEGDKCYLYFKKNLVAFKRPNESGKSVFLMYENFDKETGNYVFRDGYGQLIIVNPVSNWVAYYHSDNGKGRYLKKTQYMLEVLKKETKK